MQFVTAAVLIGALELSASESFDDYKTSLFMVSMGDWVGQGKNYAFIQGENAKFSMDQSLYDGTINIRIRTLTNEGQIPNPKNTGDRQDPHIPANALSVLPGPFFPHPNTLSPLAPNKM